MKSTLFIWCTTEKSQSWCLDKSVHVYNNGCQALLSWLIGWKRLAVKEVYHPLGEKQNWQLQCLWSQWFDQVQLVWSTDDLDSRIMHIGDLRHQAWGWVLHKRKKKISLKTFDPTMTSAWRWLGSKSARFGSQSNQTRARKRMSTTRRTCSPGTPRRDIRGAVKSHDSAPRFHASPETDIPWTHNQSMNKNTCDHLS